MIQQRLNQEKNHHPESGFTLIEFLVVIVILGILSAVVVFAVRGTGDKGRATSFVVDAKTLRTAEEAYCAQNGTYGTEAQLAGQFVSEASRLHNITVFSGGNCGGKGYAITCSLLEVACGTGGTIPDGDFGVPDPDGVAGGNWVRTTDLPGVYDGGHAVTLPDGRAFFIGRNTKNTPTLSVRIYDPVTGNWTTGPMFSSPPLSTSTAGNIIFRSTLLTGSVNECGTLCGRVLAQFISFMSTPRQVRWLLYDPTAPAASAWSDAPAIPAGSISPTAGNTMTQITNCTRGPANPHCGKVLVTGGKNEFSGTVTAYKQALLFDPAAPAATAWSATADMLQPRDSHLATALADGRVLVVEGNPAIDTTISAEIFDPTGNGGTGGWTSATSPNENTYTAFDASSSSLTLLHDGTVLAVGGSGFTRMAQRYNPAGGTGSWTTVALQSDPAACEWCRTHQAIRLPQAYGNKVLILSGTCCSATVGPIAKLYDPSAPLASASAWTNAAPTLLTSHGSSTPNRWSAALVGNRVLLAGGRELSSLSSPSVLRAELYTPTVPVP